MRDATLTEFVKETTGYRYPYIAMEADGALWINRALYEDLFLQRIPASCETRLVRTDPGRQHRFVRLSEADMLAVLELAGEKRHLRLGGTTVGSDVVAQLVRMFPDSGAQSGESAS